MSDIELLVIVVGTAAVLLATVTAWLESRIEKREQPEHRQVLRRTRAYRERLARWKGRR